MVTLKRTACSACGYDDLVQFLDLGHTPIADAYTESADALSTMYPLQLAVCSGCWLVQLLEVVDHRILFGTGYSFYTSASPPLSAYHADYASDILSRHWELAKRFTVEIGCNDGDFLRHFADAKCPVLGIDPASGPVAQAEALGLLVLKESFERDCAERICFDHGPAGLIVANHVLAHVENVADMLNGIQYLLADDGLAYIEVQYLPDLLVNNAFDLVYHEHRNFFSLTSLENAIERWGLHIIAAELTHRQGGSLRITLAHNRGPHLERDRIRASETWLQDICAYRGFQGRINRIRDRLSDIVHNLEGLTIGYGAPAKATTLLNFCGLDNDSIEQVIDTTTAKQGRYIPGTGIQIVAPADMNLREVDNILLLSWNYAEQIMRNYRGYNGKWIIPIPSPMLL